MDASDLAEIGLSDPAGQVSRLAALAQSSGADGVVFPRKKPAAVGGERGPALAAGHPGIRLATLSRRPAPGDDPSAPPSPLARLSGDWLADHPRRRAVCRVQSY